MTKRFFHRLFFMTVLLGVGVAFVAAAAPAAPPVPPPPGAPGPVPAIAPVPTDKAAPPALPAPAAAPAVPTAASGAQFVPTESWSGTVTQLQSADRMTVDHGGTATDIRLYGVDAPEPGQKQADEARKLVTTAVTGKPVNVDVLTNDNLGVAVAVVTLDDARNLSHALLEEGLAWWDLANAPDDKELKKLHALALSAGKNIWADPAPLAPWDFRASHGGEKFTYKVKMAEEVAAPAPAPAEKKEEKKDEPKKLSAKGNEEYIGTFSVPADSKLGADINPSDLIVKHMPTIAKDGSGNPLGLTAQNISQIPFASQVGLQDGDIISGVNGVPIQSEAQIMSLIPQFKDVKQFNVTLLRGGKPMNLTINVP